MNKNLIALLIIGLSFHLLTAQNRVDISTIKAKKKKVINYKTDYATHFTSKYFYYLDGEKYSGIVFENWENGNLKREMEVKNGIKVGSSKSFYSNGNIEFSDISTITEIGQYVSGFHENGKRMIVSTVLPTEKEGDTLTTYTKYDTKGKTMYVWQILSTEIDGHTIATNIRYNSNEILLFIGPYRDGKPHGLHSSYNGTSGNLSLQWY